MIRIPGYRSPAGARASRITLAAWLVVTVAAAAWPQVRRLEGLP